MWTMRITPAVVTTALAYTLLAGCAEGGDRAADLPATVTVTETVVATTSGATSTPDTTGGNVAIETFTEGSASAPPGPRAGELTLSSFFRPTPTDDNGWSETRLDVADQQQVKGIAATTRFNTCADEGRDIQHLELRLGAQYSALTFKAGQALDSVSSNRKLMVKVLNDNTQVELTGIPFGRIQEFQINVEGIAATRIEFFVDGAERYCSSAEDSVHAVFFDGTLT